MTRERDEQRKLKREAKQAEYDAWLRHKLEISRKAAREGRVKSNEEVETYFAERRKRSLRRAGGSSS